MLACNLAFWVESDTLGSLRESLSKSTMATPPHGEMAERLKATVSKTVVGVSSTMGSNPILSAIHFLTRCDTRRERAAPTGCGLWWRARWPIGRGAGVADRARLESVWAAMSRGFESRSLRHQLPHLLQALVSGSRPPVPNRQQPGRPSANCPLRHVPAGEHHPFDHEPIHLTGRFCAPRYPVLSPILDDQALQFWIAFSRIPSAGRVRLGLLESRFGSLQVAWSASQSELAAAGLDRGFVASIVEHRADVDPQREIDRIHAVGVTVLTWHDSDYPLLLREVDDLPPIQYVRGSIGAAKTVTVVGTRKPNAYGREVVKHLSGELAEAGVTIVSGMAHTPGRRACDRRLRGPRGARRHPGVWRGCRVSS